MRIRSDASRRKSGSDGSIRRGPVRRPRCQLCARSAVNITSDEASRDFGALARGPRLAERLAPAPALADLLLGRVARHDLVEDGLLARLLAQDAPEALRVLARRARAGEDDGDRCRRDVDAL